MSDTVDIKKQIIDDMLETLKQQVSRYKNLVNSSDVTLEQLKDFDNQIGEIYDTLQKVSNTELTLLINDIEEYKIQLDAKLLELNSIIENIDISSLTVSFEALTQEQKALLKGEKGDKGEDGLNGTFEDLTQEQKNILFDEFKVLINLPDILSRLEALENVSSTPAIMEKTLTYKQSEEGYNILTNFVPNEGETGFFVINLSA
ncbi:MAG: hypothetical protein AB7E37_08200, partial [Candidatus Altimarinota bacterium]